MAFSYYARKEKQADGSYGYPENPVYDALGKDGSTAEPEEVITITKKDGSTVDRVVRREVHQFPDGATIYELHPHGHEPGVSRRMFDALVARVEALEAKSVGEQAPF